MADPDAEVGDSGVVRFELSAAGVAPYAWTMRVEVGTPKLTIGRIAEPARLRARRRLHVPVRSSTGLPAGARAVRVHLGRGPDLVRQHRRQACHYLNGTPDVGDSRTAGSTWSSSRARRVPVRPAGPGPVRHEADVRATSTSAPAPATTSRPRTGSCRRSSTAEGSGPTMRLLPTDDTGNTSRACDFRVSGGSTDLDALGAPGPGGVGDTVEVKVGVTEPGTVGPRPVRPALAVRPGVRPAPGHHRRRESVSGRGRPLGSCAPGRGGAAAYTCESYGRTSPPAAARSSSSTADRRAGPGRPGLGAADPEREGQVGDQRPQPGEQRGGRRHGGDRSGRGGSEVRARPSRATTPTGTTRRSGRGPWAARRSSCWARARSGSWPCRRPARSRAPGRSGSTSGSPGR